MPKQNRIYFPEGGAFKFVGSDKVPVKSIAGQSECDCEVDCCLKAIKLPDHDGTGVKYIYIFAVLGKPENMELERNLSFVIPYASNSSIFSCRI